MTTGAAVNICTHDEKLIICSKHNHITSDVRQNTLTNTWTYLTAYFARGQMYRGASVRKVHDTPRSVGPAQVRTNFSEGNPLRKVGSVQRAGAADVFFSTRIFTNCG